MHEYGLDQVCVRCGLAFADVSKYSLVCLPPVEEEADIEDTPFIVEAKP